MSSKDFDNKGNEDFETESFLPARSAFGTPSSAVSYLLPSPREEVGEERTPWVGVLKRRRWTILLGAAFVLASVAIFTLLTPVTYESYATVLVSRPGGGEAESALQVLERVGENRTLETEMSLLTSDRVAEAVVDRLDLNVMVERSGEEVQLDDLFVRFSADREAEPGTYKITRLEGGGWGVRDSQTERVLHHGRIDSSGNARLEFAGITAVLPPDFSGPEIILRVLPLRSAVGTVKGRLAVAPVSQDAVLLQLTCQGPTAQRAQNVCNAATEAYIEMRENLQQNEVQAAAQFLAQQVEKVGDQLKQAEDSLSQYQERNQAVALEQQASAQVNQYSALQAQREQLAAERAALSQLIERTEGQGSGSYRDFASFPSFFQGGGQISDLVHTLIQLENRRSELAVTRTEINPDLAAVDARIQQVENQLHSFAVSYRNALSEQIRSLDAAVGSMSGQLSTIPERQVLTARYKRQVSGLEDLYRFLQTRLREAQVASNVNLSGIQLVDHPSLPGGPAKPNVKLNLGLGLLLGLAFGFMVALYREYNDSRIRERGEIERSTGIAVLGMIPKVKNPGPVLPVTVSGNGKNERALPVSGQGQEGEQETFSMAKHRFGRHPSTFEDEITLEAFRSLLVDLRIAENDQEEDLRSVAVTSASRGDGKTFTACNLAIASANMGLETILVDADFRGDGVVRFFGLPSSRPGLSDLLADRIDIWDAFVEIETNDARPLRVVPSGSRDNHSPGLLERNVRQLQLFLAHAEAKYDLVIFDTPPLNVLADAAAIASRVDAVMVVARGGVTNKEALELTLRRLQRTNANVAGLVLNDVELPEYYTSYSQVDQV